jgi:hypothetical protein
MKSESKKFQVRLVLGIPLIFFGLSIFTALITYYLTLHYMDLSISLPYKLQVNH